MDRPSHALLPVELIERVADHLFQLKSAPDCTGITSIICSKPSWINVQGFMKANMSFHSIGFIRWLRIIRVIDVGDWEVILKYSRFVREIQCLDHTLSGTTNQHALAQLPNLYAASIDAHSDISRDQTGTFTYQDVIVDLPPSLRRLEVLNTHGSDVQVIAVVKRCCPRMEELRLGRCTMFNRMPLCEFWLTYSHAYNVYLSSADIETYANFFGRELSPLNNLRSLRLGRYLTPSNIVLAHRLYHRHGRTAPESIDWRTAIPISKLPANTSVRPENIVPATADQFISILHQQDLELGAPFDCHECVDKTAETTRIAEMTANGILEGCIPTLENIEWMAWLTPGHLGVHSSRLSRLKK